MGRTRSRTLTVIKKHRVAAAVLLAALVIMSTFAFAVPVTENRVYCVEDKDFHLLLGEKGDYDRSIRQAAQIEDFVRQYGGACKPGTENATYKLFL